MGARFVRLEIAGFKSFAEATTLDILPGLTGVVGPNGCGKSNVAEALRWAMGEANARHLRGGEMDDVIFAGTAHRPSRNLAEVSVTLEDDGRGLPPPYQGQAELQISRRIERGGGSSYRVNGREARARDVQTLFADLASGARSSAIVSQGRVGALVNARPEERRAVLEEAAGITGLHARRAEAEMRLRATEGNLGRAEERRVQLERQAAGLQEQAQQAARYRTVTAALQETEALLLAIQRTRARLALASAEAGVAAAQAAVDSATTTAAAAMGGLEVLEAALPRLRDAEAAANSRAEQARSAAESMAADAARAQSDLNAARQRQAQLARDLAHAESVLQDAEAVDARLCAEVESLAAEAAAYPTALLASRDEAAAAAAALHAADEAASKAAAAAAQAQAEAGARRHLLLQAEARLKRAADTLARAHAERDQAAARAVDPARVVAAAKAAAEAAQRLDASRAEQDEAEAGRGRAVAAGTTGREAHTRAAATYHKLAAETAALAEVLAVKDGERWPPMIDRVTVPSGFEAALGAALGEELAAAADPSAPRHWRTLPGRAFQQTCGQELSAIVSAPPLLQHALGAIGVVQSDTEGADAQARLLPGQSVVSADGGLWRWDGYTIRPGTPSAAAVRLEQRNRLAGLRERLDEASRAADAAKAARDAAVRAEHDAAQREQQARQGRREAEAAAERARTAHRSLHAQAEATAAALAAAEERQRQVQPEADAAAAALEEAWQHHGSLPDAGQLHTEAEAARAAVGRARHRDGTAARALEALQHQEHTRQARIATIGRERLDRQMRAVDLSGRAVDLRARAEAAATELQGLSALPERATHQAAAAREALQQATAASQSARDERARAEQDAAAATTAARNAEQAVHSAREAAIRAEAALEAARATHGSTEAHIGERAGALPPLPETSESSAAAEDRARSRLQRLGREREQLGAVNLRAEAEADAVGGEIAAIIRERDEFVTSIAKLRGQIGHQNRDARERLSATFLQVDRQFQALFTRLFGGGRAHLALVGSDDPLLAGLEIFAQPPGKKLAALSLLSGGEQALTALSLVFAVFRCNPAPLCVLDEVDAPLDDANVGRFCALLFDMAQETGTRFLVVTHHQVTMAGMDRLYGVTMQERGVSRLLSVDLSRAVNMIDAVAAE